MSGLCWANILDCTDRGPRSNLANAVLVLQKDPQFSADRLWYDEFLDRVLVIGDDGAAREWRDSDDARLTFYLQHVIDMPTVAESVVASAVRYVASQRVRNCVLDYLRALKWDREPRLEHALEDHWGVVCGPDQPSEYVRAVSANLFLAMVARALKPGCQVDTMVIFEGPQGIGKSRALRVLGGAWYALAAESVTHKDFFQIFPGAWVIEIGEMDSFSKAERERTKVVISTPTDRYRPTYARHARDFPRRCIFAGTTNRDDYGNDDTGLRRFLPVRCGDIDVAGLAAARDQLFAEAYTRLLAGEAWWITPELPTKSVQRDRQSEDVWAPLVLDYLRTRADGLARTEVQIHDILREACKMPESHMTHNHKIRIGSILRSYGWEKSNLRRGGKQGKTWVAPEGE